MKLELYKFRIKEVRPNLYHLIFPNEYSLTGTLFRIQEFYESPDKKIKGQHFSIEQLMDSYAQQMGNFTYFEDWDGFNFPGDVLWDFFNESIEFTIKEENLFTHLNAHKKIQKWWPENRWVKQPDHKIYFIGTTNKKDSITRMTVAHEIAHGLYYLDPEYKRRVNYLVGSVDAPVRSSVFRQLKKQGYCKEVLVDEINAYIATSTKAQFLNDMDYPKRKKNWTDTKWKKIHSQFKTLFEKYNK